MRNITVTSTAILATFLVCQNAYAEQKSCVERAGIDSVITTVNQLRSDQNLSELVYSDTLSSVAAGHSRDMATRNTLSHEGANGSQPSDRALAAGYEYRRIAENVASGQETPESVMDGWEQSSSHLKNMLLPGLEDIGIACISDDDSAYGTWWTMMLGTRRGADEHSEKSAAGES